MIIINRQIGFVIFMIVLLHWLLTHVVYGLGQKAVY